MAVTPAPHRFERSPHLVDLIAEAERLAALVAGAPADDRRRLAETTATDVRRATLALDGANVHALPTLDEAAATAAEAGDVEAGDVEAGDVEAGDVDRGPDDRRGTWLDALRTLDEPPDTQLLALEVLGVAAAAAADDLAERLLVDTEVALAELHRRLTLGLVTDQRAGAPRMHEQAVHDASTGRIIYFAADPATIPRELGLLGAWAASTGAREHGVVASGVLHLELLRIHPYDAANGRLARAAARLVLRARGLDPDGLAAPEPALDGDRLGYAEEVARTLRRRDLTVWLERWGDAVTAGLRTSARALGVLHLDAPTRAQEFAATRDAFTVADYRAEAAAGPEDARAELAALLDAGTIARVPGSRGLRFVTTR